MNKVLVLSKGKWPSNHQASSITKFVDLSFDTKLSCISNLNSLHDQDICADVLIPRRRFSNSLTNDSLAAIKSIFVFWSRIQLTAAFATWMLFMTQNDTFYKSALINAEFQNFWHRLAIFKPNNQNWSTNLTSAQLICFSQKFLSHLSGEGTSINIFAILTPNHSRRSQRFKIFIDSKSSFWFT